MVVDELSKTQKECYDSVHHLLDPGISELDRKIKYLMSKPNEIPLTTTSVAAPDLFPQMTYTRSKAPAITTVPIEEASPTKRAETKPSKVDNSDPIVEMIPISTTVVPPTISEKSHPTVNTITTTTAPQPVKIIQQAKIKKSHSNKLKSNGTTNGNKVSIKDLEHLRAPRMPLCEYLRRNRPDILMNVEARSSYIKKISEERKSLRAYRIISSLERIRISSRTRKKTHPQKQTAQKPQREMKNFDAPDYSVRHKLCEREMKQLTLRNYRRLPEVKKQKLEEVNKHLKEQYYKNRQLYGRMLLNNFKNGIINYPLRASYDDRSITSSQSEYSMSQSADTACSLDPYY